MIYFFGETPIAGVSHLPLMETKFINPFITLSDYDFLIITSKRSIQSLEFFDYDFQNIKAYCIGEKTAEYARKKGLHVVHTSLGYAKNLIAEILPLIKGEKGLYLRPKIVANEYISDYAKEGELNAAICYETFCKEVIKKELKYPLILLFAAPSQVYCFEKHFSFHKEDIVVTIGQTTAKALPESVNHHISSEANLESLVILAQSFQ